MLPATDARYFLQFIAPSQTAAECGKIAPPSHVRGNTGEMPVLVRKLFGIGKLPADVRAAVEAEGLDLPRRFRPRHRRFSGAIPGLRSSHSVASYVGSVVFTSQRVLATPVVITQTGRAHRRRALGRNAIRRAPWRRYRRAGCSSRVTGRVPDALPHSPTRCGQAADHCLSTRNTSARVGVTTNGRPGRRICRPGSMCWQAPNGDHPRRYPPSRFAVHATGVGNVLRAAVSSLIFQANDSSATLTRQVPTMALWTITRSARRSGRRSIA